jgi:hypothetical protein
LPDSITLYPDYLWDQAVWLSYRHRELAARNRRPTFQRPLIAGAVEVRYTPLCPLL